MIADFLKRMVLTEQKPAKDKRGEVYHVTWFIGAESYHEGAAIWNGRHFEDPDGVPELIGVQPTYWYKPHQRLNGFRPIGLSLGSDKEEEDEQDEL